MKQLSPLRLAVVFSGCFLGAGYVSGQELWQFFGAYGLGGYIGIALAMVLLFGFGALILRLTQMTGLQEMDQVVVPWKIAPLRAAVGILEIIFMFGIVSIMTSGIGALLEQLFSVPHYLGSFIFCVLVLLAALAGLNGIVSAFSVSVPLLVGATFIFGLVSIFKFGLKDVQMSFTSGSNPLLGSWFSGAVTFACYNIFVTIGILTPFGKSIKSRKTIYSGLGLGVAALAIIALSVLLSLTAFPEAVDAELPMLALAESIGKPFAYVYALLLAFAMFGTSLSSLVGILDFTSRKLQRIDSNRNLFASVFIALAFLASLFGFGDLIGVLYPLFGYASAVFLAMMFVHYLIVRGKSRTAA